MTNLPVDTDDRLLWVLRRCADEWGPRGVVLTVLRLWPDALPEVDLRAVLSAPQHHRPIDEVHDRADPWHCRCNSPAAAESAP